MRQCSLDPVVGAAVLGTSLIISSIAAPVPVIGGTAVALGLGIGAGFIDKDINDKLTEAIQSVDEKPLAKAAVVDTKGVK